MLRKHGIRLWVKNMWVCLKIKPPGIGRQVLVKSKFPFTRASHFEYIFLSHSHVPKVEPCQMEPSAKTRGPLLLNFDPYPDKHEHCPFSGT